ncbi:NlpC/P60 family protein [Halocynthiibacter styelae]|uniref:C40 family peptidase n=1 Tax=Halocynthiibacter styelae TaxID=2761955 RepID=A0A8J7IXS8_9RHOB|nr:NlpC/P60 family protein [Paenihalocynthiibacter styelae]MBI1494104.1 C40 family peptidase [Paenihalocynthiibacter styelae]
MNSQIVEAARGWIGTPYVHQMSVKGAGCDCLGLLRGIWREVLGGEPADVPPYTADWSEPGRDEVLWRAACRYLVVKPLTQAATGDVLLFRMRRGAVAKHLGIQSIFGDTPAFIHAYSGHAVTESPLSTPWQRRIAARFEFPQEKN